MVKEANGPCFRQGGATMNVQLQRFVKALVLGAVLLLGSGSASAEEVTPVIPPAAELANCESAGADGCWTEIGRLLGAANFAGVRELAGEFRRLYPVDQRAQMAAALARLTEPELSDNKEAKITRQPGRVEVVTTASLYGAGLGGQLANAINADGSVAPLIVVVGLGAGLAGSIIATEDKTISEAQARLLSTGIIFGYVLTAEGLLAFAQDTGNFNGSMALGSLVGAAVGTKLAMDYPNMKLGDVSLVNSAAVIGVIGTLLGTVVVLGDDAKPILEDAKFWLSATVASTGAGVALAHKWDITSGRMTLINLGGLAGLLAGGAVIALGADSMNARSAAAIELGAGIAGLASAAYLTRDNESASLGLPGRGVASVVPTVFHDGKQSYPGLMMAATW
jgi:hypothetical protein